VQGCSAAPFFGRWSSAFTGMHTITNRRHPLVAQFREAAQGEHRLMLLDGVHLVEEAAQAGLRIRHVIVSSDALEQRDVGRILEALIGREADIAVAGRAVMDAVSPVRSPSSIAALADRPSHPADGPYRDAEPFVLVAADVQDPGNLGAIVRVAEASGATGLIVAGASADPFGWKALRGSMGSALRLPIAADRDALNAIGQARHHGCRVIATVARGGLPYVDTDFRRATAVVVGAEGAGLAEALVSAADAHVSIPMQAPVESLNVAVAAAILAYEARRQRLSPERPVPVRAHR
jgi:TrmH family RNA methyltransferase